MKEQPLKGQKSDKELTDLLHKLWKIMKNLMSQLLLSNDFTILEESFRKKTREMKNSKEQMATFRDESIKKALVRC